MSRIDLSGARTRKRRRLAFGLAGRSETVTSFGTSWARRAGLQARATSRTATTANRLNNLPERYDSSTRLSVPSILAPAEPASRDSATRSARAAIPCILGRRLRGGADGACDAIAEILIGATLVALLVALGVGQAMLDRRPRHRPSRLPTLRSRSVLAQADAEQLGVRADDRPRHRRSDDHVWIIHRGNDPGNLDRTELAHADAPDAARASASAATGAAGAGVRLRPATSSAAGAARSPARRISGPSRNHGIVVDHKGFVWIGGNGGPDAHILKFTRDGKFVAQYGKAGARKDPKSPADKPVYIANSNDMDNFGRVAKIFIDPKANEGYVADGYFNQRVAVIDLDSGKIKRYLGRLRQAADRRRRSAATIPSAPLAAAVPQPGALRRDVERRHGLRLRPPERPRPGVHEGRQVRQRSTSSTQTRCRTARCGTSRSRRTRSSSSSTWPTAPTSTCASSTASR